MDELKKYIKQQRKNKVKTSEIINSLTAQGYDNSLIKRKVYTQIFINYLFNFLIVLAILIFIVLFIMEPGY